MTRDELAAHALTGMLAHSRNNHGYRPRNPEQHWHDAISQEAYEIADCMLKVKRNGGCKVMFLRWVFWFCVGMALGFAIVFVMAQEVKAEHHSNDSQHWYDGACCNDHDCYKLETHVRGTAAGWYIEETNELIPYGDSRERISKDKYFHRCIHSLKHWQKEKRGTTRCLYVPGFGS